MAEARFYALARGSAERTLRVMLERTLARGERAIVRIADEERLSEIDAALWQEPPESFLPHARKQDGFSEEQNIYLTTEEENPNGARVLFQLQEGGSEALDFPPSNYAYNLACLLFAAEDAAACARAQALWEVVRIRQREGGEATFWRQDARGGWQKSEPQPRETRPNPPPPQQQTPLPAPAPASNRAEEQEKEKEKEKGEKEEERKKEEVSLSQSRLL